MNTHNHFRPSLRLQFIRPSLVVPLVVLVVLGAEQSKAVEWFLKIDGVSGPVTEGRFGGWTPVESVSAFVSASDVSTNGTGARPAFSFEIRKGFDCVSPWLLESCGRNETNRRVTLMCTLPQPKPALYRIILENVLVSAVSQDETTSSTESLQTEVVHFMFDKIEMACLELDSNGGTAGGLTAVYDQVSGQGVLKSRPPFRVGIWGQGAGVVLSWPAEAGHRYHILSRDTVNESWRKLAEAKASEDGPLTQIMPITAPALFMRVDEVD